MAATDSTVRVDCRICGTPFEYQRVPGPGRLRRFCSEACKLGSEARRLSLIAECVTCGGEFCPRYRGQKVCGLNCRRAPAFIGPRNKKKSRPPLREVACCGCGITTMRRMKANEAGRYCSQACYAEKRKRLRNEIDALYRIGSRSRHQAKTPPGKPALPAHVADEIQALRRIGRRKVRKIRTERGCGTCGVPVVGLLNWPRTCIACKAASRRKQIRISKAKRRARKRATSIESIDPIAVFDRDGWQCYLCGISTPRYLRGTREPNAPELEHKLALANGGTHTWENVACACRRCNALKGARLAA